jgi:hypothetical protein
VRVEASDAPRDRARAREAGEEGCPGLRAARRLGWQPCEAGLRGTARTRALALTPARLRPRARSASGLHDNLSALRESLRAVETDAEARRVMRRYSQHLLLMLGCEVDRLEALIRQKCPEFRFIDLEVL